MVRSGASSSWLPAPPGSTVAGKGARTPSQCASALTAISPDWEIAPHEHNVVIDRPFDSDGTFVFHRISGERVTLPACASWDILFDEDGAGSLFDTSDRHPCILIEDIFTRQVYKTRDGEYMAVVKGSMPFQCFSLSDNMRRKQMVTFEMKVAPSWSVQQWDVCFIDMPRQRCRFMWNAHGLYTNLGMDTYELQPSRWFYNSADAFESYIQKRGLRDNHIFKAAHGNRRARPGDEPHFMPWPAVTTTALLCLLCRFATQTPQTQQSARAQMLPTAARYDLQSLLSGCLCTRGTVQFQVQVRFVKAWDDQWPASWATPPDIVLTVDNAGMVDLTPWADHLRDQTPSKVAHKWWNIMLSEQLVHHNSVRVCFSDLLAGWCAHSKLRALFAQACVQTSQRVEVARLVSLKKGDAGTHGVRVRVSDPLSTANTYQMDYQLCREMRALDLAAAPVIAFHIGTDKANVNGVTIMNSLISFHGWAQILTPQAPLCQITFSGRLFLATFCFGKQNQVQLLADYENKWCTTCTRENAATSCLRFPHYEDSCAQLLLETTRVEIVHHFFQLL